MRKLFLLFYMFCTPVFSATGFSDGLGVGVGVSATSGMNVLVGYRGLGDISPMFRCFGARVDFATMSPLKSVADSIIDSYMKNGRDIGDGVKIDNGSLDTWHSLLLLDYYPFAGAWRISGGYAWGGATLNSSIFGIVKDAPSERFYFYLSGDHYFYNGNNFDGSVTVDWDYHGPYLGSGFDFRLGCGFEMYLDAGFVITSRPAHLVLNVPQEQLYVYNIADGEWVPVNLPQLDSDIARATRDANNKLDDLRLYPMVKIGFLYRF